MQDHPGQPRLRALRFRGAEVKIVVRNRRAALNFSGGWTECKRRSIIRHQPPMYSPHSRIAATSVALQVLGAAEDTVQDDLQRLLRKLEVSGDRAEALGAASRRP